MASQSRALEQFDFHDGQYLSHFADDDTCVISFRDWQERLFRIECSRVVGIKCFCGGASLCEATIKSDTALIDECRRMLASEKPELQDMPLTELSISDDVPLISVVFSEAQVIGPLDESESE